MPGPNAVVTGPTRHGSQLSIMMGDHGSEEVEIMIPLLLMIAGPRIPSRLPWEGKRHSEGGNLGFGRALQPERLVQRGLVCSWGLGEIETESGIDQDLDRRGLGGEARAVRKAVPWGRKGTRRQGLGSREGGRCWELEHVLVVVLAAAAGYSEYCIYGFGGSFLERDHVLRRSSNA